MLDRIRPRPAAPAPRFDRPPYPIGWFAVARSEEVAAGALLPVRALGRDLVLFRGADGVARVLDAYCPHLGAHLGHGGCVEGDRVRCPFHRWAFDGDGRCVDIPYARKIPAAAAIEAWETCEASGLVFVFHDPTGAAPRYRLPAVPELDSPDWARQPDRTFTIRGHVQDMAENAVDRAHFGCVHGLSDVRDMTAQADGATLRVRSQLQYPAHLGGATGTLLTESCGLGFNVTRFSGVISTLLVVCATPIEPELSVVRITPYLQRPDDPALGEAIGALFLSEVEAQFTADIPIWEHKVMRLRPVLCDGDGPIGAFRRWTRQFYADAGRDGAADGG